MTNFNIHVDKAPPYIPGTPRRPNKNCMKTTTHGLDMERYFCYAMHPMTCYEWCQKYDDCVGYVASIHPCSEIYMCYLKTNMNHPSQTFIPYEPLVDVYRMYGTKDCMPFLGNRPYWFWPITRERDRSCFYNVDRYPNGTLHIPKGVRPKEYNVNSLNAMAMRSLSGNFSNK